MLNNLFFMRKNRQVETTASRKTYHRNADTKNKSNSTADVIQMERKSRKNLNVHLDMKVHTYTLTYSVTQF